MSITKQTAADTQLHLGSSQSTILGFGFYVPPTIMRDLLLRGSTLPHIDFVALTFV